VSEREYSGNTPEHAVTFPEFVRGAAAAYGDELAISLKGDTIPDDALTFSELERHSAKLARALLAHGVGKGTRVGFIYCNGPSFAVVFAALARIGAIAVPLSTLIKSNELVRVLRQSDVSGLILQRSMLGKDFIERLCDALPDIATCRTPELRLSEVPFLRWVVSTGDSLPDSVHDMSWLLDRAGSVSDELLQTVESEVHPTDQIMEIYTSGSMALPKGVKHNHGPVLFRTHYVRGKTPSATRGAQLPATFPMFWIGGLLMNLLVNWEAGAVSVCTESTSTDSRVAMGSVVAEVDMYDIAEGMTMWALGMTETIGPYSFGDTLRVAGYPLCTPLDHIADGFEVRLADERDTPVPEGEKGEIQVRGYPLTPGLHKVERDAYFTADGFYRTGDMGIAQEGRILFVGREGDMIKTANSNVSPAEVELEMQQLEGVHSAYVVGIPDQERGQLLVAAVVPREDVALNIESLHAQLKQRLSGFKVPREYVLFERDEVPMLHSNKVARRQIGKIIEEKLGRC
jgi:acyl-coenzyme A synthetase/AMP-(fatty) acid ligase